MLCWVLGRRCRHDVAGLRHLLIHPNRCGYAAKSVWVKTGKGTIWGSIMAELNWWHARPKAGPSRGATAMISFTGHSNADAGDYCLIPFDANLNRIKTSTITADDQATDMAELPLRRLPAVLYCCHAACEGSTPGASAAHRIAVPPV
jgi:hypothetical protein